MKDRDKQVSFRVNTLKTTDEQVLNKLHEWNIEVTPTSIPHAYITGEEIRTTTLIEKGEIYLQNLSAMIPALILDPKSQENILDMCAAPGGKTTQMCALASNKAFICAVEKDKFRAERLKHNLSLLGAKNVNVLVADALGLDRNMKFNKVLLDAPCSGSGTGNERIEQAWLERHTRLQRKLLSRAIDVTKVGGIVVYSTCSVLTCENEDVVADVLSTGRVEIARIDNTYNCPTATPTIPGVLSIKRQGPYEGFFVAKLRRIK